MDKERATWIRCFSILCHTCNISFLKLLAKMDGSYICSDEATLKRDCMDVARFLVRTKCSIVLNESFSVQINDEVFRIKMVEDYHAPLRIGVRNKHECSNKSEIDSDSDSSWGTNKVGGHED